MLLTVQRGTFFSFFLYPITSTLTVTYRSQGNVFSNNRWQKKDIFPRTTVFWHSLNWQQYDGSLLLTNLLYRSILIWIFQYQMVIYSYVQYRNLGFPNTNKTVFSDFIVSSWAFVFRWNVFVHKYLVCFHFIFYINNLNIL